MAIHQDTANAAAVTDTARPELMAASITWFRSLLVGRAGVRPVRWIRRTTVAGSRLHTAPAVLGLEDLHSAGHGNFPDPLEAPFLPPRRDEIAAGACRWQAGFDNDLAPTILQDGGGNDAVVGQLESAGSSVGRHPGRLSQGS